MMWLSVERDSFVTRKRKTWWRQFLEDNARWRPQLSLKLCLFEEHYSLCFFGIWLRMGFLQRWHRDPHSMMEAWGFYYNEGAFVVEYGEDSKFFHMPWQWSFCKSHVMFPDGSWLEREDRGWSDLYDGRWVITCEYDALVGQGQTQRTTATVYADKMEWRWRAFKWLPYPSKVRRSIDIRFSSPVGDRGTTGCGYGIRSGELPIMTLRRMERERIFD